jgi:cytochrome oxidase Cu insertion factor (SCO1/SenC/PrrC family)
MMKRKEISLEKMILNVIVLVCFLNVFPIIGSTQPLFRKLPDFPSFPLVAGDGSLFSSTAVIKKNKPTVVIYFSPTCQHCQTQAQDLTSNMKSFRDVQFLFVTSYPPQDTKSFLNEYAIEKFTNIKFGYDSSFSMGSFYDLKSLPGIFIYDKNGKFKNNFDTNVKPEKLYTAIFGTEPGQIP